MRIKVFKTYYVKEVAYPRNRTRAYRFYIELDYYVKVYHAAKLPYVKHT